MNIRFFTIISLLAISMVTSSCGIKRALTLPKDPEKTASKKSTDKQQNASSQALSAPDNTTTSGTTMDPYSSETASAKSIDVLKPQR